MTPSALVHASPLRISCEWAGPPVRERVRKKRRATAPFSAPLSRASAPAKESDQRRSGRRPRPGSSEHVLLKHSILRQEGFPALTPSPPPSCAHPLRPASPGPDKGSFRASWSTTFNYLTAGEKVLMLYNADKVSLNAFLAKAEWRNQRRD